jgi:hypothetical protein
MFGAGYSALSQHCTNSGKEKTPLGLCDKYSRLYVHICRKYMKSGSMHKYI